MENAKQKLNSILTEEVDRSTFLKRSGILLLAAFGVTRLLHLNLTSLQPPSQDHTSTDGLASNAAAHARAMAVSSMRI